MATGSRHLKHADVRLSLARPHSIPPARTARGARTEGAAPGADAMTRSLGARIVAAREEERSRIARELHDDLGQQTAMLATNIQMLLRSSEVSIEALRAGIIEAQRRVQDLAVAIHHLARELHPPKLKLLGLVKTLESLCQQVAKDSGLSVTFHATRVPPQLPEHVSLCLCRVAQEALQNAVKHSGARAVEVVLTNTSSRVTLRVHDEGRGFSPAASHGAGIGLITMRERVELTGGRLSIRSAPDSGSTIDASVPIAPLY